MLHKYLSVESAILSGFVTTFPPTSRDEFFVYFDSMLSSIFIGLQVFFYIPLTRMNLACKVFLSFEFMALALITNLLVSFQ